MPQTPDAESSLAKLGQRLRDGWAKQHPTQEHELDAVREAIREQWAREREAKTHEGKNPDPTIAGPEQSEPDLGR